MAPQGGELHLAILPSFSIAGCDDPSACPEHRLELPGSGSIRVSYGAVERP
jgi:hypothetical protein